MPAGTSNLRSRHHREAAVVDRAAFGDPWGNDARDLAEIRHATPVHRATARFVTRAVTPARRPAPAARRLRHHRRRLGQGYLQRLAVDPDAQRQGHGRALVLDSVAWMRRRRLTHGVVNTAVGNAPALALYESLGFRRLTEQLVVMQLDLDPMNVIAFPGHAGRHCVPRPRRPRLATRALALARSSSWRSLARIGDMVDQ